MTLTMKTMASHIALLSVAACASAPKPMAGAAADELRLCATQVSNAPTADRFRRILGYEPLAIIDGVPIARAPAAACVSSGFGPRRGGAGRHHDGVDLFTGSPSAVVAGGDGIIVAMDTLRGYGRTILIRHTDRLQTRYAHLSRYASGLSVGDRVARGEMIGATGRSGNATAVHLHYEILIDGAPQNPLSVGGLPRGPRS